MESTSSSSFDETDIQTPLDRLYQRDVFAVDEPKIKPLREHTFSKLNTSQDIAFGNLQLTNTGLYVLKKAYRDLGFDEVQNDEVSQIYENAVAKLEAERGKRLRKYDASHGTKAWVVTHAFRWVKSGYHEMRIRKLTKTTFKKMEKARAKTEGQKVESNRVHGKDSSEKTTKKYLDHEFSVIYEAHISSAVEKHLKIDGNYENILGAKETAHRLAPDMDSIAKQAYIETFLRNYVDAELPKGYKNIGHSLAEHMIHSFQKEQTSKAAIRNQFKNSVIRSYTSSKGNPPSDEYLRKLDAFLNQHFDPIYELCEEAYIPPFRTSMEAKLTPKGDPLEKSQMLVNPWQEVVSRGGETMEVARSGAYTDFSDTSTNILKLEKETSAQTDRIQKEIEQLETTLAKRKETVRQMAGTAIAQQALQFAQHNEERINEGLSRPNFAVNQGYFFFSQVSLVHAETEGKEGNMLQDMNWALNETFFNKKIIFDGRSEIDDQGNIHVPHEINDGDFKLTIIPKLYNCTVKGKDPKSTEIQDTVNKQTLTNLQVHVKEFKTWHSETYMPWLDGTIKKLERQGRGRSKQDAANLRKLRKERDQLKANPPGKIIDAKLAAIKEKIEGSKSGYDLAVDISEIEMLMQSRVAINCKSGKDRTGLLFNKLSTNFFVRNSPKKPRSKAARIKARHKIAKEVDKNSASRPITGMNVLIKGFKRHPREIEGRSIYARIRNSVMGLFVFS